MIGFALALPILAGSGQTSIPPDPEAAGAPLLTHVAHGSNAPEQAGKHTVVLVLLHGFRADFAARYGAKNLLAMTAHGASAPDGMVPSWPPAALPNSYTLVTGLYPGHHGIVGDVFRSGDGTRLFRGDDPLSTTDGSWFGGIPLWVLAEQQGMRSASLFWPGSAAEITAGRPTFYAREGGSASDPARVEQTLAWLHLPEAERPHLCALALTAIDSASLRSGRDDSQRRAAVEEAVLDADRRIGRLRAGIAALHLPINLVIVSDLAAAETAGEWIDLDAYADLSKSRTAGPLIYADYDAEAQKIYNSLKIADARFAVYRRANLPKGLHVSSNARIGDPVVVANGPFAIRAHAPTASDPGNSPEADSPVYDPRQTTATRPVFYAEGPDVRAGVRLQPFENTNVYPFVAALLGLQLPILDGSAGVLSPALKDNH